MKRTSKPFNIHFVCRGNTYRSRLAAAYMATLLDDRFAVSSSGIASDQSRLKTVEAYTKAVAKHHKLTYGLVDSKTQTTDALLAKADVIVFMSKDTYDEASRVFTFDSRKALVWDVQDISKALKAKYLEKKDIGLVMGDAERSFFRIRERCDELKEYLTHTAWVDVMDETNRAAGLRLPMAWATDRGLWHRGVHVIVQTVDGKYVVGKRTKSIIFAPGMLEISLGGGIDSGETPLQAAARETHEELGVHLPEKHFRPLFVYRQNTFHSRYNKRTRAHIYVYSVTLPLRSERLRPQPGEVEELRLLTRRQVKHMLNAHRMEHFGRLKWDMRLYHQAIKYHVLPQ